MIHSFINTQRNLLQDFQAPQSGLRLFISMILLLTTTTTAQWNTQSPVPTQLDIRGIGAPSAQKVFIATDDNSSDNGGSLFETTDGGANWNQLNVPFSLSDPFYGLFFLDSQNGWAYGNDNYRTTDGGTTWSQLQFLGSTYFMKFYSSNFGLATGNFGQYISRDGGLSWEPSPNNMNSFDFIDAQTGLGASNNGIYKTTDGGVTFASVKTGAAEAVEFLTVTLAVGIVDSIFVRSSDGGETWTSGVTAEGRNRLLSVSGNVILAWGHSGSFPDFDDRVFRSTDGGQIWSDLGEIVPSGIFALVVADPQTVIASDFDGNLFRSSDAGLNWTQTFVSPGPRPGFLSSAAPVFPNSQTGYFGYGAGFIIKTNNGGASWSQISSGSGESLNDIDRFANGNMIAVGDNGTILTSSEGTSQWILRPAISQYRIKAVQIVNPGEAVLLDEIGQVFTSTDGGASWTAAGTAPPGLSPAEDIDFSTLQDGWVTGQGGTSLYHTSNGGNTWIPVNDFGGAYVSVDVEGTNIWANNITGIFYRSTDNGSTWIPGTLPNSPSQILDMDFFDENTGYAVGWGGKAYRSSDGGANWQVLPTPNEDDQLTDIYLVGPNELWVSTNSNAAYYSANGGQNWAVLDIGLSGFGNFSAITANSSGDAWAVGFQGYIQHFTGPPPPPLNQPPTASFNYVANGLTLHCTDASTDADGTIISWTWNFGDGIFSSEQNPTHTYAEANTYIVQLKVTDDDGASDSTIRII
ncbi:MAG TPA: YCF48-related protein, partial [Ignavibacteriaceae bacterium]